ncbi:hypothetical protein FGO68_gene4995 [Halteria grandinella]|uniref:Uncharacterized protein n=1 Tax=Halteria grandinella TaxID=5974 RepID=A0A8J8NRH3_HALGN|nr:hypothetical protein FGO68_gene4995 [Halteria grandinella]
MLQPVQILFYFTDTFHYSSPESVIELFHTSISQQTSVISGNNMCFVFQREQHIFQAATFFDAMPEYKTIRIFPTLQPSPYSRRQSLDLTLSK